MWNAILPRLVSLLVSALLFLAGCGRSVSSVADVSVTVPPIEVELGDPPHDAADSEFIRKYQPDVRLNAQWREGEVWISIQNRSPRILQINPGHFGVIVDGVLYQVRPGDVRMEFPSVTLKQNEGVTGRIQFLKLDSLAGQYCVFNHPGVRPSRCRILRAQATEGAKSGDPSQIETQIQDSDIGRRRLRGSSATD